MEKLVLGLHVTICVVLVFVVLLQSGKEGMGVIFGGGGSSFFGSSGAGGALAKLTALLAVIFIVTSLVYNIMTRPQISADQSIMESIEIEKKTPPDPLNSTQPISSEKDMLEKSVQKNMTGNNVPAKNATVK